jgi:hypothetical protein
MFYNSPENKPEGLFFGDGNLEPPKRKNRRLKLGFFILAIGFAVALISMVTKMIVEK